LCSGMVSFAPLALEDFTLPTSSSCSCAPCFIQRLHSPALCFVPVCLGPGASR
jgi:hypothetical protein